MVIFFIFPPTSSHLHPLQVANCDSNLRLVADEDDNGKFRLERVKKPMLWVYGHYIFLIHSARAPFLIQNLTPKDGPAMKG